MENGRVKTEEHATRASVVPMNKKWTTISTEVESRTQGSRPRTKKSKAKDTKKSKAKDSLSEDRPSRGQGQECSRPRTKDTDAGVLQKKGLQKSFSGNLQFIGGPRIFDWGGLNHKSHAMTSSKFFKRTRFCGTKISYDGRSEIVACWHLTRILQRESA